MKTLKASPIRVFPLPGRPAFTPEDGRSSIASAKPPFRLDFSCLNWHSHISVRLADSGIDLSGFDGIVLTASVPKDGMLLGVGLSDGRNTSRRAVFSLGRKPEPRLISFDSLSGVDYSSIVNIHLFGSFDLNGCTSKTRMDFRLTLSALRLFKGGGLDGSLVPPTDERIRLEGRWGQVGPEAAESDWPVAVRCRFKGSAIGMRMTDGHANWMVAIDGNPARHIVSGHTTDTLLASGLGTGTHTMELCRTSEASRGRISFKGLLLPKDGRILPLPPERKLKLLFFGDSITCGGGNWNFMPGGNREKTNSYFAYPAIVARTLDAEAHIVARGGIGMWRNWDGSRKPSSHVAVLPDYFDRPFFDNGGDDPHRWTPKPLWDHSRFQPDAVTVFLGTNDCCTVDLGDGERPVDRPAFRKAYVRFLGRIRKAYPNAWIFCISPVCPAQSHTICRMDIERVVKSRRDPKIVHCNIFEGGGWQMASGGTPWLDTGSKDFIGDWTHPTVEGHEKLARGLAGQIRHKLGLTEGRQG
jgi:lysophospholipase L1-like esterase